jgi:pimeloyl-ACP methyl ester carboxylesterase
MNDEIKAQAPLHHRQVEVEGISIHVIEGGDAGKPAVLFLHGWPEDWSSFEQVMITLSEEAHVVALDLPGIGESEMPPAANDKRTLARYVRGVITQMGLREMTLVGHDLGGQIVYAYLHAYPNELRRAVMMNIAVPGVDPWEEVERNPYIWHFAFHSVPKLPEELVAGHEAHYFDFFYNILSAKRDGVSKAARERYVKSYARADALKTGFEWYRAFGQDEKDNLAVKGEVVQTPVLYLRGEKESGDLEVYLKGFREGGLRNVQGGIIAGSGHFAADEQPEEVVAMVREFMGLA